MVVKPRFQVVVNATRLTWFVHDCAIVAVIVNSCNGQIFNVRDSLHVNY